MDKGGQFATTTSWQNFGTLIKNSAINGRLGTRIQRNVVLFCPDGSAGNVSFAPNFGTAAPTDTAPINTIVVGKYRSYDELNFDECWVKSAIASTIEFQTAEDE